MKNEMEAKVLYRLCQLDVEERSGFTTALAITLPIKQFKALMHFEYYYGLEDDWYKLFPKGLSLEDFIIWYKFKKLEPMPTRFTLEIDGVRTWEEDYCNLDYKTASLYADELINIGHEVTIKKEL